MSRNKRILANGIVFGDWEYVAKYGCFAFARQKRAVIE
jgi:hypothetical protein